MTPRVENQGRGAFWVGRRGTLTPFVPLSPSRDSGQALRAIKGEGERKTEGAVGAPAPTAPSSLVLVEREGMTVSGGRV